LRIRAATARFLFQADYPMSAPTRKSRILIADDNVPNVELLEAYLSGLDCETAIAVDGRDTLAKVEQFQPDLILLDIMMPKLSGYEVCHSIKTNPRTKDIPVLMVTALNEQGDIERAVRAGCDDFLTKPVNSLELKTRVKSLLRVRHLTNERDRLLAYMADIEGTHTRLETR
jgi:two-component system, OmpR family, alkaline phosphatase synthesis response regulator PhoP